MDPESLKQIFTVTDQEAMPDRFSCWRRRKARRTCEQARRRWPHSRPRRSPSPAPKVGNKKNPTKKINKNPPKKTHPKKPPKHPLKMGCGFFKFLIFYENKTNFSL
jgi:hypothetical protein